MNISPNAMSHFQTLKLHKSDVNSVAFGKNNTLASGSSDKKVYVYQWVKGVGYQPTTFSPLTDHKYGVCCCEFSPFGTLLATCSVDGLTILWDVSAGQKLHAFVQPLNSPVRVCRFSGNATYLVTGGDTGAVYLWDVSKRNLHTSLIGHEDAVFALSFAPEGNYVVSGCSAGILNLWDGQSPKPIATVDCAHDLGVTCADFAAEVIDNIGGLGKICLLATAGNDQVIRLWNVYLGLAGDNDNLDTISISTTDSANRYGADNYFEELRTFTGHGGSVMSIKCLGHLIASSSGDKTIRVWEMSGKCIKILEGHERFVTCVDFSKNHSPSSPLMLASGSNDKSVMIWDLSGDLSKDEDLSGVDYSLNPETLWNPYEKVCKARLLQEKEEVVMKANFTIPKADFNSCALVAGGADGALLLAAASSSKVPFCWDLESGTQIDLSKVVAHRYGVNFVAYSHTASLCASASADGSVMLFNLAERKKIGSIIIPSGSVVRVAKFSPDGSHILIAGDDEKASLWNINLNSGASNFTLIKEFVGHESSVYAVAFTPDGQYAITGSVAGKLNLWDCREDAAPSGAPILSPSEGHELGVVCCEFSPKGFGGAKGTCRIMLASGGNDALIKLWQVYISPSGARARIDHWKTFNEHGTANIHSLSFSPSGKLLATGAGDHFIRIFDISSGNCIEAIEGHNRFVTGVSFAPQSHGQSTTLVSCSNDHSVKVWTLSGSLAMEASTVENVGIENLISSWSDEDVVGWLKEIGLERHGGLFKEHGINGERLILMNEAYMINQMGIEDPEIRKQIQSEVQWLKVFGTSSGKGEEVVPEVANDAKPGRPVSARPPQQTIVAPAEFFCPITHDIMVEPVTATDGRTYERAAITEWFLTGKTVSPVSGEELASLTITPNFDLQSKISEFLAQCLK